MQEYYLFLAKFWSVAYWLLKAESCVTFVNIFFIKNGVESSRFVSSLT